MKTFDEYLDKMGYCWNDFDRTYEMENLIEQYDDEKVKQALSIANVVGRSEQLPQIYGLIKCECGKVYDVDLEKQCPECGNCLQRFCIKYRAFIHDALNY